MRYTSDPADAKLISNVDITIAAYDASVADFLDHVFVALPRCSTHRTCHLIPSTAILPFGGCPHLKALFVNVLAALCSAVDSGICGLERHEADGAIALYFLAILVYLWLHRIITNFYSMGGA
jgi:hypothetical protein